jgi:hypothetical protein
MNLITDKKLSCAQRIIMMYLRSLDTPEWTGKLVELAVPIGISESAVCTDTIRLAELGYLRRERISKNAGTRLSGFESIGKPQSFKKGEEHTRARLTADQVRDIRHRVQQGEDRYSLAIEYETKTQNITKIVNRVTWKHL